MFFFMEKYGKLSVNFHPVATYLFLSFLIMTTGYCHLQYSEYHTYISDIFLSEQSWSCFYLQSQNHRKLLLTLLYIIRLESVKCQTWIEYKNLQWLWAGDWKIPSLRITIWHRSASLMMPNSYTKWRNFQVTQPLWILLRIILTI